MPSSARRDAALRQYRECVAVLCRELRVEPEAETRQVYGTFYANGHGGRRKPDASWPDRIRAASRSSDSRRDSAPLIGRDGELAALHQALGQARAGAGQLVVIVGEPGIGKTRLIEEIMIQASQLDARVLLGRCHESDQILPFGPWVDALRTSGITSDSEFLDELPLPWRAELTRLLPEVAFDEIRPRKAEID